MSTKKNLIGQRFSKLVVINYAVSKNNKTYYECLCDCGNKKEIYSCSLTRGKTKSCGCINSPSIVGKRVNKLVVIAEKIIDGKKLWECVCDCGNYKTVTASALSKLQSCGCIRKNIISSRRSVDLSDQIFGRLVVINKIKSSGSSKFLCKCECGNEKIIPGKHLLNGKTASCGCLFNEIRSNGSSRKYEPKIASALSVWKSHYKDGDITFEQFLELSQKNCYYCNSPPSNKRNIFKNNKNSSLKSIENGYFIYNGLDRVDNSFDTHLLSNTVTACSTCNYAKSNMPLEDFMNWIKELCKHQMNKGLLDK